MNMYLFVDVILFCLDEYDMSFDEHDMQVYMPCFGYDNMLI